ncbi:hypothetical protein B0H34DRAFT_723399 [Crassisporium funariophilum]|nr:hypothetical protein B0H34DRAFT_723399 [Crassisporium funariophilum]
MWIYFVSLLFSILTVTVSAAPPLVPQRNDGIHLAVRPNCGQLSGTTADVNAGLEPWKFKTLVSFGDSFTNGGKGDGAPLSPPDSPEGGRSTNGLLWVEHVANDMGATLMDYAQSGACIDLALWPSNPTKVDFLGQVKTFLNQSNTLDPETTLYSVFFGINDYMASLRDGDHMQAAANTLIDQISILASPPTNARNFMVLDVYGRGTTAPSGERFKQTIFSALRDFRNGQPTSGGAMAPSPLNVAYVDFATIWEGVLGPRPGYKAFGYTSPDACTACSSGCTPEGMCTDPEHYFYWISGHPSKQTMRIMADFVDAALTMCRT